MNLFEKIKLVFNPNLDTIIENLNRYNAEYDNSKESLSAKNSIIGLNKLAGRDISSAVLKNDISMGLLAAYGKVNADRDSYEKSYEEVKNFYITDALLSTFSDDALTPDVTSGEIVELYSTDKKIDDLLKELQEVVDIDQLVNDIIFDLLAYGEYSLRVILHEDVTKGIKKIVDDVDQKSILALYDSGLPANFLVRSKNSIRLVSPSNYIHFTLGKHKIRLHLDQYFRGSNENSTVKSIVENIPTYIRVGRPLFYGVISKIKELMLLESMIPTEVFNSIVSGSLVQLRLPASMTPRDGFDACREFENLLNSKVGVDRSRGEVSISDIVSVAGKIKVIPSFGDKGDLNRLNDIKANTSIEDISRSIKDIRETITTSIGFPSELLYGGDMTKGELLKRYARYLRRLKSIQTSIANGLKQMAYVHVVNKGIDLAQNDVNIRFRNEIVNIDELDKLEFFDAIISISDRYNTFINALAASEELKPNIDKNKFFNELKKQLKLLGASGDIINVEDEAVSDEE